MLIQKYTSKQLGINRSDYMVVNSVNIDIIPIPTAIVDEFGSIVGVNKRFSKLLLDFNLVKNGQIDTLFDESYKHSIEHLISDALNGLEAVVEVTIKLANNREEAFEVTASPIPAASSMPKNILITLQNITKTKSIKNTLIEQQRFHNTLINNLPGFVYRCKFDKNWSMEYISNACLELTGYSPDDFINNKIVAFNDIIVPSYREEIWQKWQEILKDKKFFTYEYPIFTANGLEKWVWEQGVGVYNQNNDVVALEGIIFDITDRKLTEQSLNESEAKFRTLVENAFDGIYLQRNRKFEYANHRFESLTGYTIEELCNPTFDFISILTEPSREIVELRYKSRKEGAPVDSQCELQILSKSGSIIDVEVSTVTLDSKSDVVVLGIMRDISERKRTQNLLLENEYSLKRQNEEYQELNAELIESNKRINQINEELTEAKQRAEEHDKLKSAFLANMSHEIRTPLNGILGFSQLLLNPSMTDAERSEYIGIIQSCGQQLMMIINDLIDISRIEANQVSLEIKTININDLLSEQLLLFKPKATEKSITIQLMDFPKGIRPLIETDPSRLRQILSSLIGNAIKFTVEGAVEFGYSYRGDKLEFVIKDTGIGIPESMLESVFERFRQVEVDLSRQAGGTGLGLSISRALVNKLGGEIWVESNMGSGSAFYFTIPYHTKALLKEDTLINPDIKRLSLTRKANILIAEDNEVNYLYLKELLRDIEANLTWATNGEEVIDLIKSNPSIDLVLMDIKMPKMDGYEATRIAKQMRSDLPIIAQTAYAMSGDREKAIEAGCDDYITKPINKGKLVELVTSFLSLVNQK